MKHRQLIYPSYKIFSSSLKLKNSDVFMVRVDGTVIWDELIVKVRDCTVLLDKISEHRKTFKYIVKKNGCHDTTYFECPRIWDLFFNHEFDSFEIYAHREDTVADYLKNNFPSLKILM